MSQPEGTLASRATILSSELYIYYKVTPEQRAGAVAAVLDLLARSRALGVSARLMRRRDVADDGTETWMEVYGNVLPDFDAVLADLVAQTGLANMIGERRQEWFIAC